MWLIALLVSGWLIFQHCCLRPVALLLVRCRCVSPCCLLIFCFPKYGPICLRCLPPPQPYTGPERMGGSGRRRRGAGRENYLWLIGNLNGCGVWRITKVTVSGFPLLPLVPCCTNHSACRRSGVCVWMCASDSLRERVYLWCSESNAEADEEHRACGGPVYSVHLNC